MLARLLSFAPLQRLTIRAFHTLWYNAETTWKRNTFAGHRILQCPLDLQLYQEVICRVRPDFIVQTGVAGGGSLLYFATLFDLLEAPESAVVIGVDTALTEEARRLRHRRVRMIEGNSVDSTTLKAVRALAPLDSGFVSLDSSHATAHVAAELLAYRDFVRVGSFLVVEDTNINGHPVAPGCGEDPLRAVAAFLKSDDRFVSDDELWRRNLFSFHQGGWLRRIK